MKLPLEKSKGPWKKGKKVKRLRIIKTENEEFNKYAEGVIKNIHKEYPKLLKQAKSYENELNIKVHKVALSGSYSRGTPNENSDIDIKVYYSGDLKPEDVAESMTGNISSSWGLHDIHAEKI